MSSRKVCISSRLDDYKPFFDHDWAMKLIDRGRLANSDIYQAAFDLVFAWKGTSHTFRMPWLVVELIAANAESLMAEMRPLALAISDDLSESVIAKICKGLPGPKKGQIRTEIRKIAINAERNRKAIRPKVEKEQIWNYMFGVQDFQLGLTAIQASTYSSLYFQYEAFLIRCLKVATDTESIRVTGPGNREFLQIAGDVLGMDGKRECWEDKPIEIARETRTSIVHNGGRPTECLMKLPHPFDVLDGHLQIMAQHTIALFQLLKERANIVADRSQAYIARRA